MTQGLSTTVHEVEGVGQLVHGVVVVAYYEGVGE